MWYDWYPGWDLPVLLAVSLLGKPIAGIVVAASVSAIAAAATGEVVSIKKSVFTGVGVGVAVNVLIGIAAVTADTGYGIGLYRGYSFSGYPAHYLFTVPLSSALAFYAVPAVVAAAVIWAMARRPNAGFSTLRESMLVGGSAGLILLAVGVLGDRMASFFGSFIVVIAAALIAPSMSYIAIVVGIAAATLIAPFIVAIGVGIAAAFAVRIIRARRAGDGAGSGVAR